MRWLYTAIIASSAILMRGEAIGQAVDVSLYGGHLTPVRTAVQALRERSILHYATIVPRYCSKRGRYDFLAQGGVIRHLFISNHDGVAERAVAYQSNTSSASNLKATDRNLSFMIPCFLLLFHIRTG